MYPLSLLTLFLAVHDDNRAARLNSAKCEDVAPQTFVVHSRLIMNGATTPDDPVRRLRHDIRGCLNSLVLTAEVLGEDLEPAR